MSDEQTAPQAAEPPPIWTAASFTRAGGETVSGLAKTRRDGGLRFEVLATVEKGEALRDADGTAWVVVEVRHSPDERRRYSWATMMAVELEVKPPLNQSAPEPEPQTSEAVHERDYDNGE